MKLFPDKSVTISKSSSDARVNLYNLIDFGEADMSTVNIKPRIGTVTWEFERKAYEWIYGVDNEFSLLMSSDLEVTLYAGYNGTHTKVINALGNSVGEAKNYLMTVGGYQSIRLSTIWAEDSNFANHYVPFYINSDNVLVIFFPDNELFVEYKEFTRMNECKVTGHYRIEKKPGVLDKEITEISIWNTISDINNPESAFTIVQFTLVNFQDAKGGRIQLFEPEIKKDLIEVRWLDCKYYGKTDFYCYANLKMKDGDTGGHKFRSFLIKRVITTVDEKQVVSFKKVLEYGMLGSSVLKMTKDPYFKQKKDKKSMLFTFDMITRQFKRCNITPDFDIENVITYNQDCGQYLTYDFLKGHSAEEYYLTKIVNTEHFIIGQARKRQTGGAYTLERMAIVGKYKRFPDLTAQKKLKLVATSEKRIFYVDQRSELATPTRGFLTPTLMYRVVNRVTETEGEVVNDEEIIISDKDNSVTLKFQILFDYSNFKFEFDLRSNSKQIFKLINPLIYHEYWYRPIQCKGDFFIHNYDANHKYKVNIEHYFMTYLPHEAYESSNLATLKAQRVDSEFSLQHRRSGIVNFGVNEVDYNAGAKLKTGEIVLDL